MERRKPNFLQKIYSREINGTFFRGRPDVHKKAIKLFGGSIPERLMFFLQEIFGNRTEHILVGTTRCGQFLVTYNFLVDLSRPDHQTQFKYRLHWWAFHGALPAHKVAEVQLFDGQDITHPVHVGIAQWPNVNDRLVVYGYSDEIDHPYLDDRELSELDSSMANRKYFITVTTLPSLHNCRDCKATAESFDEEDMPRMWESAVSFSCLRHGLTIHTTLDVAPPYPVFDAATSLKVDYKIIVNTGSLLHVLFFDLDKTVKTSTERDTIVPDEISHRIGEILSSKLADYHCPWKKSGNTSSMSVMHRKTLPKSINKAWHNSIMDRANQVYAFEDSDDCFEPRFKWFKKKRLADKMYEFCSEDEDMENKCPPVKVARLSQPLTGSQNSSETCRTSDITKAAMIKLERKITMTDSPLDTKDKDHRFSRPLAPGDAGVSLKCPEKPMFFKSLKPNFETNSKVSVPNSNVCDNESNNCDTSLNKSSDRTILSPSPGESAEPDPADLYTFMDINKPRAVESSCCDKVPVSVDKENSVDPHSRPSQQTVVNNCYKQVDQDTSTTLTCDSPPTPAASDSKVMPSKSDQFNHNVSPLDISVINPDLSAILAEWEADSVSSLSPRSDSLSKNDVIQSFLELIPGMTISPRSSSFGAGSSSGGGGGEAMSPKVNDIAHPVSKVSSPNLSTKYSPLLVVLRTRNCNQDNELQKTREHEDKGKGFSKEDVNAKVAAKSTKEPDVSLRQRMISGCSVRFDRIYIELDDEILSTISTDLEEYMVDDADGTGFHCALPLSVHGSAYAQLQMVSRHKAEKMSMDCERVYQTSFDIEQFCFKAADIICQCEGFKFWFCSDYDVELIDVCAFNDDILGIVCMRVNAEKKPPKNELYTKVNQRIFYGIKCVFLWNPVADRCVLEAYSPLVETRQVGRVREAPARREAERIRHHLHATTLFLLPPHPPPRNVEHRMWVNEMLTPSIEELRDYKNLVGFRLFPSRITHTRRVLRGRRRIVEVWD